ncbi:MAG: hypothetical protein LQ338_000508 [Usnochroma carphineum]|nr:MAG: hypothetical protein LQ338_000508 [Usnochroma carphineum]
MSAANTTAHLVGDPDVMNDPAFDPSGNGKRKKSVDEPDTCRICRAEASHDEPLFYPCKCSGSIKFVHQNCLMEWLSHSQKKHCELCKTPFRFTKLYHPHMPAAVPTLVFLRQVLIHTWKSLVAWSRMHLVVFVWLCWLPWSMRNVWRGLFYLGDGGWFNWARMEQEALRAAKEHLDNLAAEGTSPAPPKFFLSGEYTASMVMSRLADAFPEMASRTLSLTTGEPVVFRLARGLLRRLMGRSKSSVTPSAPQTPLVNASQVFDVPYRSSWLSDVRFLKTLTRYPMLNNVLIDTLEGQLITLFIVIAFILVFLIREWVVQQQPAVNVPAAVEAQAPMPAMEDGNLPIEGAQEPQNDAQQGLDRTVDAPQSRDDGALPPDPDTAAQGSSREVLGNVSEVDGVSEKDVPTQGPLDSQENLPETSELSNFQQRPGMPDRGTLARAAEIRRTIEEQSRATGQDWPGLKIFMDLWTRAENQPGEVLRIIEEEGRSEELAWVMAAMRRLENIPVPALDEAKSLEGTSGDQSSRQGDAASSSNRTEAEAPGSDLARRIFESEYDLSKGLGAPDHLDGVSSGRERGSSVPIIETDEDEPAPGTGTIDVAGRRRLSGGVSPAQPSNQASAPNEHSPDVPIQTNDNPFHPDYAGPLPPPPQESTVAGHPNQPAQAASSQGTVTGSEASQSLLERTMTWLWGEGMLRTAESGAQAAPDDEQIVQDLANEAPFVPMEHGQPLIEDHDPDDQDDVAEGPAQDPQVVAEAVQAGLDPNEAEAVEEIEDLEGVMELVGMQGPIAGLIQNGMFCAVLVSLTIFVAIWIPYIMGKLFLIIVANPVSLLFKMPLQWAAGSADLLSDTVIFSLSCTYYWVAKTINFMCSPVKRIGLVSRLLYGEEILADVAKDYAEQALDRLTEAFAATSGRLSDSDIPTFSILAHESLKSLQRRVTDAVDSLISSAIAICTSEPYQYLGKWPDYQYLAATMVEQSTLLSQIISVRTHDALTWLVSLRQVNLLRLNVGIPQRTQPLDFTLAYWDTKDRALTIIFGYLFFGVLGVLYLRLSSLFQSERDSKKVKGVVADALYQAGGVMKVILIISIEMIVFPLYCGLLLDVALLPLFHGVSILSRLEFMVNSPCTSLFVHWFVGTCYMFHFALFVSMCRKIMRTGVLYFIRDPDDPTFHPVRDVLERSVFTQLCKIAFSALVYGGLVIVCLGGVVWGIASAFDGVFPIYWSSNDPVLEFPVDLLFYNFLMPLAVKVLRPSDGLTKMYAWWFRKCARALRLSHFLFGDRRKEEEGHHVRRTWNDMLGGKGGDAKNPVIGHDRQKLDEDRGVDAFSLGDGRYVRTPASDQVRIPKGAHTFVEVDEAGNRLDGQPDNDQGLHGRNNQQFSTVYIPPHFRLRIAAFIFLLWLFAAATGVCLTVLPLVFGRYVFSHLFPSHPRMNDVYAFSIGINILSGTVFVLLNGQKIIAYVRQHLVPSRGSNAFNVLRGTAYYAVRLIRVLYTYTAFAFLLPSLVALIMELYFILPCHTYFGKGIADHHDIYFIQDWTLGVLWVQMIGQLILWNEHARPAIALRNIVQDGWTDPHVRLATRGFIFPATLLLSTLLIMPLGLGWLVNTLSSTQSHDVRSAVYRYSYPGVLALAIGAVALHYASKAFKGWKRRIRDEVYLIGERLHNFGERRTPSAAVGGTRVTM